MSSLPKPSDDQEMQPLNTNIQDNEEGSSPVKQSEFQENPRSGFKIVGFMRGVYKCIRTYYVCFNYYFMPFFAIMLTFMYKE
mmetsp:Transcript_17384/g.26780  ORF Transcript_17384/g.26780 Transcript_17384/m.26780 type:complete len:82 (+) Transcript_17384:1063-1308(+)